MASQPQAGPIRVSYIAHEASRTGAPIMLLRLMTWQHAREDLVQSTVLRAVGPLLAEFNDLGPTAIPPRRGRFRASAMRQASSLIENRRWRYPAAVRQFRNADVVYANSIESAELFDLVPSDVPIIAHIHEMGPSIARTPPATIELLTDRTTHFVAASAAVRGGLEGVLGVDQCRITVVNSFLDRIPDRAPLPTRLALRRELGISDTDLVVGGAGKIGIGKGVDLLPRLVRLVNERTPAHLIWAGRGDQGFLQMVERDAVMLGVGDRLHFVGEIEDTVSWFSAFDVFALTSREDSFPLVALENAALGNPIACFEGSGSVTDYVDDRAGAVVEFLDLDAMALAIARMAERGLRSDLGAEAARRARLYTADRLAPRISEVIRNTVTSHTARRI